MLPVLFTIGKIPISSYGVFLGIGFLIGIFLIWRLARAWDLDEEKILDLTLLTFLGGFLGARLYYVLLNLQLFSQNLLSMVAFNRIPGFSFWGAFLGGLFTLYFFAKRRRIHFYEVSDIACIGFIAGLVLSDLGCFLAGCNIGIQSNLFFAVNMVGSLGRRFPTQALEAILLLLVLIKLWSSTTHFHQRGKILGLSFTFIGVIKLLTESLSQSRSEGIFLSPMLCVLGINILYKVTKRNLKEDVKSFAIFLGKFATDSQTRKNTLARVSKYWYNQKTSLSWWLRNFKKGVKRINVRLFYKNNKLY